MTPAGRTQAAIELLDRIIAAAREGGAAGDSLVQRYFATRRYAGSKDRRAVRELVYAAIRRAGERPSSGRAAMLALVEDDPTLAAAFDGSAHGPAPIESGEKRASAGVAPGWLVEALLASGLRREDMPALVERAPLDIRVNTLVATRDAVQAALPDAIASARSPGALRLPSGTNVEALDQWRDGAIEVQDEGSQIVGQAVEARPGERIVDLCAGAGGKSLALSAAMKNEGLILACDIDRGRLARLAPRAVRAHVGIVETRLLDPGRELAMLDDRRGCADAVLIDAPCSGTGTWRRNPEARWRLTPERLAALQATQRHVLDVGAELVKSGGRLVYIVCSLLDDEGRGQVNAFLDRYPGWIAEALDLPLGRPHGPGVRLDPAHAATDGFFVARLRRPC